uniref:Pseudouridylate synthase 7 homolog n=1 Tax=Petromyzon marinus TaxID=7757 RepID=A0AAJ7TWR6_PETMA
MEAAKRGRESGEAEEARPEKRPRGEGRGDAAGEAHAGDERETRGESAGGDDAAGGGDDVAGGDDAAAGGGGGGDGGDVVVREQGGEEFAELMKHGLVEVDVGIAEFVSHLAGFSGILKERYSDFVVHEINEEGKVLHLDDLNPPASQEEVRVDVDTGPLTDEQLALLADLQAGKGHDFLMEVEHLSKDSRAELHRAVRARFPRLETRTEQRDARRVIVAYRTASLTGRDSRVNSWPKARGSFCRFVLYKENRDTMDAVSSLASLVRVRPGTFSYVGTKDKRAVTVQEVAALRVSAERLAQLNRCLRGVRLGNFSYARSGLRLGALQGNRFSVVLRNVTGTEEQVAAAMTSLRDSGFINYYGMQRFGTTAVPTHHVGRAMLQGNWPEVLDLVLKPRPGAERPELVRCRQEWGRSRDAALALALLPARCRGGVEGRLLQGLTRHAPGDITGAFSCIPRNTRLMYLHSYQSAVWNAAASARIRLLGLRPVPGDLVLDHDGSPVLLDAASAPAASVLDVVLPLPGFDVVYPTHKVGDVYREMLSADGLDVDKLRHRVREYSLSGAYRKVIVRPRGMTWELCRYDDSTVPLIATDLDLLEGRSPAPAQPEGRYRALKMEFSLPPSSYATMAVREVLKMDTSIRSQSALNTTNTTGGGGGGRNTARDTARNTDTTTSTDTTTTTTTTTDTTTPSRDTTTTMDIATTTTMDIA